MTERQFIAKCTERLIDPEIALENAEVHAALANRQDSKVLELLDTEF